RHIFIVTGPAGCGKSTVAQTLASNLSLPYIEGDDYHTPASVEKMAHSIPLTDADRWDWLILLRDTAMSRLTAGAPGVVVTCSALKRKYRDVIRAAAYADHAVLVHFLYLRASEEVLLQRVTARAGHYMKSAMVHSQFHDLEEPGNQEQNLDVLVVDVEHNDIKEVSRLAVDAVTKVL
ncbi:carbohydrate kinase, partial [Xylona heveae TC161]